MFALVNSDQNRIRTRLARLPRNTLLSAPIRAGKVRVSRTNRIKQKLQKYRDRFSGRLRALSQIRASIQRNDFGLARKLISRALSSHPHDSSTNIQAARCELLRGNEAGAAEYLAQVDGDDLQANLFLRTG